MSISHPIGRAMKLCSVCVVSVTVVAYPLDCSHNGVRAKNGKQLRRGFDMMSVQQLEDVAREWQRDWEKEIRVRHLLRTLVREQPRWRRWAGRVMVWIGASIMRSGERLERPQCQDCMAAAG
jgi:hypothetical protein